MKVGDHVTRMVGGSIPMPLIVTAINDNIVTCGSWQFCATTGAEIDDDLDWGPPPKGTGSYIRLEGAD